ncbi:hypothetical protein Pst134EA_015029 [Puccinia striiformis f. sp. tritici]|uniref:hypothetical protein n=1 Tax=Puccinia striiformis f. sp. tritici TaxID=168172 RepID=UPI002007F23C|nr:hypothetical protein Pst134EA_015029 [Puccinia striiformis f. sp. tritici]KAH9462945.1 hypothetical protein Pst134EA_015029 [Puccinia striiformis f. sp. tritici]
MDTGKCFVFIGCTYQTSKSFRAGALRSRARYTSVFAFKLQEFYGVIAHVEMMWSALVTSPAWDGLTTQHPCQCNSWLRSQAPDNRWDAKDLDQFRKRSNEISFFFVEYSSHQSQSSTSFGLLVLS